jgi:hypothetical protein
MSNFVCKSYFDAIDAEEDVQTLVASGQPRSDITVIFSERARSRYRKESADRGLRCGSMVAQAITGSPHPSGFQATLIEEGEAGASVTVWGRLSKPLVARPGIHACGQLLDLMILGGQFKLYQPRALQNVPARA